MSTLRTEELLKNSTAVASVGKRSFTQRNIKKMVAGAMVISLAFAVAPKLQAQTVSYNNVQRVSQNDTTTQNQNNGIPGTVVSIRSIHQPSQSVYERRIENSKRHTSNVAKSIVGSFLSSVVGSRVDNSYARRAARTATREAVNVTAAKVRENRANQNRNNIEQVNNYKEVTIRVKVNGRYEMFKVTQTAAVPLKRGEAIYLVTASDGNARVVPKEVKAKQTNTASVTHKSTRAWPGF